jgi:hypothetical protein
MVSVSATILSSGHLSSGDRVGASNIAQNALRGINNVAKVPGSTPKNTQTFTPAVNPIQ